MVNGPSMRRVAFITVLSLAGCNFAVKHPAVTVGTVAGVIALGTLELNTSDQAKSFEISGVIGVSLGGIAAIALAIGNWRTGEGQASPPPPPPVDWSKIPDTTPVVTPAPTPHPAPAPSPAPTP